MLRPVSVLKHVGQIGVDVIERVYLSQALDPTPPQRDGPVSDRLIA